MQGEEPCEKLLHERVFVKHRFCYDQHEQSFIADSGDFWACGKCSDRIRKQNFFSRNCVKFLKVKIWRCINLLKIFYKICLNDNVDFVVALLTEIPTKTSISFDKIDIADFNFCPTLVAIRYLTSMFCFNTFIKNHAEPFPKKIWENFVKNDTVTR